MSATAIIIDDSTTIRGRLRLELTRIGVTVVAEGGTGELALPLYEQHAPTFILVDIVLPGIDGITAVTGLLRKHPEAAVVMCSSITDRDKILVCRNLGVKHFILKPFTSAKIAEVVDVVLGKSAPAPAQPPQAVETLPATPGASHVP